LNEANEKFVLYEYLLYFWKKKIYFIIVPLITTLLVAGIVYALKNDKKYTGVLTVFTGGVDLSGLTDPDNIQANYKDIKGLDVFVSEKGQVKFTVKGNSEEQVQKEIDHIKKTYLDRLNQQADKQLSTTKEIIATQEDLIKALKPYLEDFNSKISNNQLSDEQSELIHQKEADLTDAIAQVKKSKTDLAFFEIPQINSVDVHRSKTYLPESIAIGIILGLIFTTALLMFVKYWGDAKEYYKNKKLK
jgi:ribosomal protein S18